MGGIWSTVLNFYFPLDEGYVNRPQYPSAGGVSDLTTAQWLRDPQNALYEREFLVTQFKRARFENRDAEWRKAERQLARYLEGVRLRDQQEGRAQGTLYGIVAIGHLARFYEWENGALQGMRLHPLGRRDTDSDRFDIRQNRIAIHHRFSRIRNHH